MCRDGRSPAATTPPDHLEHLDRRPGARAAGDRRPGGGAGGGVDDPRGRRGFARGDHACRERTGSRCSPITSSSRTGATSAAGARTPPGRSTPSAPIRTGRTPIARTRTGRIRTGPIPTGANPYRPTRTERTCRPRPRFRRASREFPPRDLTGPGTHPRIAVLDTGLAEGAQAPRPARKRERLRPDPRGPGVPDSNLVNAAGITWASDNWLDPVAGHGTFIAGVLEQLAPGCTIQVLT